MRNHGLVTPDIGRSGEDRTRDLVFPKHASYRWTTLRRLVGVGGIEPPTSCPPDTRPTTGLHSENQVVN